MKLGSAIYSGFQPVALQVEAVGSGLGYYRGEAAVNLSTAAECP